MAERDWRQDADASDFADYEMPAPPHGTPGKSTLTSRLTAAPVTNIIFRVATAEAASALAQSLMLDSPVRHDSNGVANDAEAAVSRAAATTGEPLSEPMRERFESSLGTSLAGVRVHTGSASAAAAKAVGARAYTSGQDIHFAEGQYGSDPFSMHLLAHEVAHTVQQAGGGAIRQHKLEVSTPGDALEQEADRAADAMVAGLPATVSAASADLLRRTPDREGVTNAWSVGADGNGATYTPAADNDPSALPPGYGNAHGAQEKFARPDPTCPYMHEENWGAIGAVIDLDDPSPVEKSAIKWLPHKPFLRPDGSPAQTGLGSPTDKAQRDYYMFNVASSQLAFDMSYDEAVSIYNGLVPEVTAFNNAAKEAEKNGLFDIKGADWDRPKDPTANLDSYGDKQMVGPDGKKQEVGSLFEKNGDLAVDTSKVAESSGAGSLDESIKAAIDTAEGAVEKAVGAYSLHLAKHQQLQQQLRDEMSAAKIIEEKVEAKNLNDEKTRLAKAQADATRVAEFAIGMTMTLAQGIANPGVGLAKAAPFLVNHVGVGAKTIIGQHYTTKIADVDKKLSASADKILQMEDFVSKAKIADKKTSIAISGSQFGQLETDIKTAEEARKKAYDALAERTKKAAKDGGASPEEQARVDAAIKAIPVCEEALSRIGKVSSMAKVPAYSGYSGTGYNGAGKPAKFAGLIGYLKGYQQEYTSYQAKWTKRLSLLQQMVQGLHTKH